jgi:O-methyltransferase
VWPAEPPPGYLGQLDPEFQRRLAQRWADVRLEDCYFYHCSLLPDGSFVDGPWDLLDNESEYLGGIDLAGRSVLEFGPASGWITVWMAKQGADVVILDLGWDLSTDLIPLAQFELAQTRWEQVAFAGRVENAWWYLRKAYGHSARAVYAPIYDLPADLGRYDVSVFASILLHLRDPFRALEQAAAVTDDTIVVVEPLGVPAEDIDRPILFWNPTESANPNGWWLLTPGVITNMLAILGFPNSTVTYHRQYFRPETAPGSAPVEATLFTVVARRH